ncbi:peptidase G2-like protein [Paraburkholderia caballeronis]|uniref:peptidase G2 autoproteolytic cleavage domain-containing protein n=1 Tax=Paraburkholderia caballeronis TaxID=416943 RepID=UPI0010659257|nr:peptidase G2 autoproteolytic cleavage domain-containing protein [Paraburkholderia caballeronis]TDV37317.1 peptidase G2-like protein [Paraburkholderia caballeronis]
MTRRVFLNQFGVHAAVVAGGVFLSRRAAAQPAADSTDERPAEGALISDSADTGEGERPYTSPITGAVTDSGRSTKDLFVLLASQNCRSYGPARAVNIGSIYSRAKGNISGNYSARQCRADVPQSVNLASEECRAYSGFRNVNIGSFNSDNSGETGTNIATRRSHTSAKHTANIASVDASAGGGLGAEFNVMVSNGAVTSVQIIAGGQGYEETDEVVFYDRRGAGRGAAGTLVLSSGVVKGVSVTGGGAGYSSDVQMAVRTRGNYSANIASANGCKTYGELSANLAANACVAFGARSANIAAAESRTGGNYSMNLAAHACVATGGNAATMASRRSSAAADQSLVLAGQLAAASAIGAVVIGRRVVNDEPHSVAFGEGVAGEASVANRKFHLRSDGNIQTSGALSGPSSLTGYAEYFENLDAKIIPLGSLVALEGRRVRPTRAGDSTVGVVCATAVVVAGDSPFTWSNRFLTGEFGEVLYDEIPDPDWPAMIPDPDWKKSAARSGEERPMIKNPERAKLIRVPRENPQYDPGRKNVSRSDRPSEWTCTGLVGQVHARVTANVAPGNYVAAGNNGLGDKSTAQTNLLCLEIRQPYSGHKGYGVALCLVR